jgi:predicted thioesterase
MATPKNIAHFLVNDQGTIFLLTPVTEAATEWASEYLPDDAIHFGNAVVVEHRFIGDIVSGFMNDGLTCEAS